MWLVRAEGIVHTLHVSYMYVSWTIVKATDVNSFMDHPVVFDKIVESKLIVYKSFRQLLNLLFNLTYTDNFIAVPYVLMCVEVAISNRKHDYIRVMALIEECFSLLHQDSFVKCRYTYYTYLRTLCTHTWIILVLPSILTQPWLNSLPLPHRTNLKSQAPIFPSTSSLL